MYSEILRYAKTDEEKELLVKEVELLLESIYKTTEENFDNVLKTKVRSGVAVAIRDALNSNKIEIGKLLTDLQSEIKKLVPMRITLAIEPTEEMLEEMYNYITKHVTGIYLVVSVNKALIGGMTIEFKGKFYDFSLKEKLGKMNIMISK